MAALSLKISVVESNLVKTMQFDPSIQVFDAIRLIREKLAETNIGQGNDHFYITIKVNLLCRQSSEHFHKFEPKTQYLVRTCFMTFRKFQLAYYYTITVSS